MGDVLTTSEARRKWKGYPETQAVAVEMIRAGWRLEARTSGHVSAWCPHGRPGRGAKPIQLYSTPQNDGNHARRVARETRKCPDRHEEMDAR